MTGLKASFTSTYFKKRILLHDRCGSKFQTVNVRLPVGDLKPASSEGIGSKNGFEMADKWIIDSFKLATRGGMSSNPDGRQIPYNHPGSSTLQTSF